MTSFKTLLAGLAFVVGCGTTTETADIGDATAGGYTFHIFREGPAAGDGVMTTLVLKATVGGMPTSIAGWIGVSDESSTKVAAVYDANDGDYDLDMTCPSPLLDGSKFWFAVDTNGVVATGSIDLK